MVNFRQKTSALLKTSEPEQKDFLLSLLDIVGKCLGMDTLCFKESVLDIVDELEASLCTPVMFPMVSAMHD